MIAPTDLDARQLASLMGRADPLTKIAVDLAWIAALVVTLDPRPTLVILVAAILAAVVLGRIPPARFARAWLPFALAALGVVVVNAVFGGANGDPSAAVVVSLGPLHVTGPALRTAVVLGLRILAIAAVGVAFAQTTEATTLADSLVQHARLPDRFAYGALAAYQAVPRLSMDLATLRDARRTRGLAMSWSPGLLFALLILALRRAERMAIAMDARGFDVPGPRGRFRVVRFSGVDAVVVVLGIAVILVAGLAAAAPPA